MKSKFKVGDRVRVFERGIMNGFVDLGMEGVVAKHDRGGNPIVSFDSPWADGWTLTGFREKSCQFTRDSSLELVEAVAEQPTPTSTDTLTIGDHVMLTGKDANFGAGPLWGTIYKDISPFEMFEVVDVSAVVDSRIYLNVKGLVSGRTFRGIDARRFTKVDDLIKAPKRKVKVSPVGKKSLAPQTANVLSILKAKGSITALEAAGVERVRSLSRRICDLKEAGYTITRKLSEDTKGQRYARYYLVDEPQAQAA